MMARGLWLVAAVALLGLGAAGCVDYGGMDVGRADDALGVADGQGDGDGAAGLAAGACRGHADCAADERCFDGRCLAEPPECGGPPPYPECEWGLGEQACAQAHGWYRCSPIVPEHCWCECASGDAGCACWKDAHCRGHCRGDDADCAATRVGTCSPTRAGYQLGCHCMADPQATAGFVMICAD